MLDLVFTLILAGCADGAAECTVIERVPVTAASLSVCETLLEERLLAPPGEWPEVAGLCIPGNDIAFLPDGWREKNLVIAGR